MRGTRIIQLGTINKRKNVDEKRVACYVTVHPFRSSERDDRSVLVHNSSFCETE